MIEIIRDGAWQFAGVVLTLLGIAVAIAIYYLQKQRKELAFKVLSIRSLLTVSEELANRVVISFDGAPIANIQLVLLGIKNSGDKPILATDFERPFSIGFGQVAMLLSADVSKQSPTNLGAKIATAEQRVELTPLLLNPGDYIVIKVLLAAPQVEVHSDVRIVGISELAPLNEGTRLRPGALRNLIVNILILTAIGIFSVALNHFGWLSNSQQQPQTPIPPWEIAGGVSVIVLLLILFTLRDWIVGRIRNNDRRYIDGA